MDIQAGAGTGPTQHLSDTARVQCRASGGAGEMDQDVLVVDQVLDRTELVEQIGVERADHVIGDRAEHPVDGVTVPGWGRWGVGLRASPVGVVVAADDMNVRVGALPAGMVPGQVQVAEP
ncbi:hypothetical protein [Nocardia terpenica]|uniref:hypothetical protein n=1 Tax=Nocardia terpenica TaxID=455432 RepID=UPI002F91965B